MKSELLGVFLAIGVDSALLPIQILQILSVTIQAPRGIFPLLGLRTPVPVIKFLWALKSHRKLQSTNRIKALTPGHSSGLGRPLPSF